MWLSLAALASSSEVVGRMRSRTRAAGGRKNVEYGAFIILINTKPNCVVRVRVCVREYVDLNKGKDNKGVLGWHGAWRVVAPAGRFGIRWSCSWINNDNADNCLVSEPPDSRLSRIVWRVTCNDTILRTEAGM